MGNWTRCFHPVPGAAVRLLCFPHAGGSAGAYHALSAAVAGAVEPWVVQYPGRHDRFGEPFAEQVDEIVDAVLAELPDGPSPALFGHSMGALVAFETARRLQAQGRPPAALFVSGREAPSRPWPRGGLVKPGSELSELGDAELVAEMRALSGTAQELLDEPGILDLVLPPLRADYRALERYAYRPAPLLTCPLVALTGDHDPRVGLEGARAWQEEAGDSFACHVLPGGHFYLDAQLPYIAQVVTEVAGAAVTCSRM